MRAEQRICEAPPNTLLLHRLHTKAQIINYIQFSGDFISEMRVNRKALLFYVFTEGEDILCKNRNKVNEEIRNMCRVDFYYLYIFFIITYLCILCSIDYYSLFFFIP